MFDNIFVWYLSNLSFSGKRSKDEQCQLSLSMALIEIQISDLSDKIDLANAVATDIDNHFLSETGHLTSGVKSEDDVKKDIEKGNNILKKWGKKIGISLATAYLQG